MKNKNPDRLFKDSQDFYFYGSQLPQGEYPREIISSLVPVNVERF